MPKGVAVHAVCYRLGYLHVSPPVPDATEFASGSAAGDLGDAGSLNGSMRGKGRYGRGAARRGVADAEPGQSQFILGEKDVESSSDRTAIR